MRKRSRSVSQGVVSVILVNFRGVDDTLEAIDNLRALDWPRESLEIVVVENASGDDSMKRLKAVGDDIVLIESKANLGFAGGCNLGVKRSSGEVVAFLNNDARPDPKWVANAMRRLASSPTVGAVASRVLDWDGGTIDYVGAAMTWFGMGYKPFATQEATVAGSDPRDVLFGTGSAMFVRRAVFDQLHGFDELFFMFFEDVDFGWRLNLAGYRFVYEPSSIAFHKHHASMAEFGPFKETYLLERNSIYALYKNLDEESLGIHLGPALALVARRAVGRGDLKSDQFDLRLGGDDTTQDLSISKQTIAGLFAIDQFVENLPELQQRRQHIQATRVVSDARLWSLFGETDAPSYSGDHYREGYANLTQAFPVTATPRPTRVLVVTGDPLGAKLAGPAIRAWSIAELLARDHGVTLVTLGRSEVTGAPFTIAEVAPHDDRAFARFEREADVIIFQGLAMAMFPSLRRSSKIIVADIYDPMHLEQLEQGRELPSAQWSKQVSDATAVLNEQLERGDFFLCASERQRHFYLGQLAALGRINPLTYGDDPDLDHLIAVAPFGLAAEPPRHERSVLKGVEPHIGSDDKLVLWSGGLYNWFDPETLIRAIALLGRDHDDVRLFFQGTKHPHPGVPEMGVVARSRSLADELGLLDTHVFFNSTWVDFADRQNYLTEADAGVSTHFAHVETTFSFRTRILDYLWAELPMVLTEGDHFAEVVAANELGVVVPAGDVEALARGLERVLYDDEFAARAKANIRRVRSTYEWSNTLAPLVQFVERPHRAADFSGSSSSSSAGNGTNRIAKRPRHGFRHEVGLVQHYLVNGGPLVVAQKVAGRLSRPRRRG